MDPLLVSERASAMWAPDRKGAATKGLTERLRMETYRGKRVLVTGHTGFKGSWLSLWLQELGAEVCGVALPISAAERHWQLLDLSMRSEACDIRAGAGLQRIFADFRPEVVFHLAAQPLVRLSYREPVETFAVNVVGTATVLEACRQCASVRAVVAISSDKCYENREWLWGYRENDPMGGYDPYSASKGCAELVIGAFRRSYFLPASYGREHNVFSASARSGNVIGGGDWAADRLVPDLMQAAAAGTVVDIRSPQAVRPWQHVLEPLCGYLRLGERLLQGDTRCADAWNFGPDEAGTLTVAEAATALAEHWPAVRFRLADVVAAGKHPHEAGLLRLDCSKARLELGWRPGWSADEMFRRTASWYRRYSEEGVVCTRADLHDYQCALSVRCPSGGE